MNEEAKKLHKQLLLQLVDCIETTKDLLIAIDERPNFVNILGSITTETNDLLTKVKEN